MFKMCYLQKYVNSEQPADPSKEDDIQKCDKIREVDTFLAFEGLSMIVCGLG